MAVAELTIAITAAGLAAAALIFALIQTIFGLGKILASRNRCGRRVTGTFDLRAGIWFSPNTMAANPRYRMPILTLSKLRYRAPRMEQDENYREDFRPGRNYNENFNCYVDDKKTRIMGPGAPGFEKLDKPKTTLHRIAAILWAPFGASIALSICAICFPVCLVLVFRAGPSRLGDKQDMMEFDGHGCGGCTSLCCIHVSLEPVLGPFKRNKHYEDSSGVDVRIAESQTPELEAGGWVQFLMNHPRVW